ncbi:hypothetical protein ACFSTA_03305 [Ornithinibacillus salinisoli]|uniref:Group-specific protein n=1 Tax=Ornithinibacillus salinisoli TaxID=1848459 RepID=A0ABW4VUM3_9BACI
MNTKLIIVEGLPGFGKTTTANLIHDIFTENNINTELFLEGNLDHPTDYDGVSCFNEKEFECLLSASGELKGVFIDSVVKRDDDYLLPYLKIKNEYGSKFPDQLFNTIFKNDIYELPLEKNIELITNNWEVFAEKANYENKTYIFECCFIQNPVTVGMVKWGKQKEVVIDYVVRLAKIIECLNPVLFYVEQDDLEYSFKKACKERPIEWSSGFIEYYTNQGYGKEKGYEGLDGTLKVLEARRAFEEEIFDMLTMKKEKVNNSHFETEKYKSRLNEKLKFFEFL